MNIDLHTHSSYSDGSLTPQELVDLAVKEGITTLAITDHDNVLSYPVALEYVETKYKGELELVPGVEINTIWKGLEIHILGYYMDLENKGFLEMLSGQQHARVDQTVKIIKELKNQAGIELNIENIKKLTEKGGSIGRPHLAKAITAVGGTRNTIEAYSKYINDSAPTYVPRKTVTPHEAVEIIYEAGGVAVLAHPYDLDKSEELIKDLMGFGLRGIEAYHRKHSPAMVEYYSSMAEKYDLIVTGGSDFHGITPSNQMYLGKNLVPSWIIDKLKREKQHISMA